jgi:hypothetical protein
VSALFLSGHCEGATQTRGHEVEGPRGAWALTNQKIQWIFQEFFKEGRFNVNTPSELMNSGLQTFDED